MYCIYCGKQIPDNSELCRYCGREVPEELIQRQQVTPISVPASSPSPALPTEKKQKKGPLAIIIVAATLVASLLLGSIVGIILYFGQFQPETLPNQGKPSTQNDSSNATDIANLQKLLMQKWTRSGTFTDNYYVYNVTYALDVTQSALTCSYTLSGEEFTVVAFGYEVISGSQIKRKGADFTYSITFNSTKTAMTISPAITSSDASETWYLEGATSIAPPSSSEELTAEVFKNWTRTDGSDGSYIKHELEFGENWFSYQYTIQNAGGGGTNYYYEVLSENQIEDIDTGIIYTFTFNDAKNVMTVSPAISSDDSSELWFYMGD